MSLIDRSTLCSFDSPFHLLHADVGNLKFLGKLEADPKYCLLFVDLFTSKVYVYAIRSRKSISANFLFSSTFTAKLKKRENVESKTANGPGA